MEARNKLASQAPLKERKTILGWLINFRQLLIILPENKYRAWTIAIKTMLSEGTMTAKELETNICRLVHLGMAVPFVHQFMSHLCNLHKTAKQQRAVKINRKYANDLELMLDFLKTAHKGISVNSIAFHCLTRLSFRFLSSRTWRIQQRWFCLVLVHPQAFKIQGIKQLVRTPGSNNFTVDRHYRGTFETTRLCSINDGQYDGRRLAPKIQLQQTGRKQTPIIGLNQGSSKISQSFHVAGIKPYSQWFKGECNEVADALSRDDDRSDNDLTNIFSTFCKLQIPNHFKILPLPEEITSWLTVLLLELPVNLQYNKEHTQSKLGHGNNGGDITSSL
jgi:hypothetical protein